MSLAQGAIFRHVAPRLAHEPHRRGVGREHAAGAHKAGFTAGHSCNFNITIVIGVNACDQELLTGDFENRLLCSVVTHPLLSCGGSTERPLHFHPGTQGGRMKSTTSSIRRACIAIASALLIAAATMAFAATKPSPKDAKTKNATQSGIRSRALQ